MGANRRDPKGDIRSERANSTWATRATGAAPAPDPLDTFQLEEMLAVGRQFQKFLHRHGGYLKVRRDIDGPDVHLTWTWNSAPLHGTYVYVRVPYWRVGWGLEVLEGKIEQSEAGTRRPTHDKLFRTPGDAK
jgi:hypothetical protein